ncbi:MAG TPA: 5'-nucleotidase C-terminal domain-containing protein, partial [Microbacterium sp.]|nr:5'-nucleotidase C-terminal domain-containing protein [Microbacterium sp.]
LGIPDHNEDQFSGIAYDGDIAQPQGSRIVNLQWHGALVADDQQFVVVIDPADFHVVNRRLARAGVPVF